MKKTNITLTFDDDKLDALEFSLRKEHSSVQSRMDDALKQLYEQAVPEAVREYLDSKAAPAPKPKRTAKAATPKAPICEPKPAAVTVKEGNWKNAIEKHLKGETLQEHLENVLDELCNQLPEQEYKRISAEIYAEDAAEREAREATRTYAAYHVTERGQEWYFKTSPGEELLVACKKLRGYVTAEKGTAPDKFIGMFFGGQPITAKEFDALTAVRMENTGKVRGVFDVNFDKREFSAVHIMDGWQTWAMRDVSAAVYHATRSQFASSDDKWRKLLDHLSGKEITSVGHLSARNFSFGDEIIESDGKLNFYVQTEFDVDAAFGTFVLTDKNDDWLNIYANYDIAEDRPCDTLELTLCKGDGSEESWSYQLNAAEQDVLLRKMEEYCQQQTGMSLHDYAQQFREEPEQQQGPVMKL